MYSNSYQDSFWKSKKVFVTGHTGFKGSWLSLLLLSMESIVGGYSLPVCKSATENRLYRDLQIDSDIQSTFDDIRNFDELKRSIASFNPDIVFHLAAQPLVRLGYQKPRDTWDINVTGSLNLLESVRELNKQCTVVIITTDKVYSNHEWNYGYRETDKLGGKDPYSSSKAAVEIMVDSWISSYCGYLRHQNPALKIATARSGNVLGGGDWAQDRLIPDLVRSLSSKESVNIRNPLSTRPWQHVLDPLRGYLMLAEFLHAGNSLGDNSAINFGPDLQSCKTVEELTHAAISFWKGTPVSVISESPEEQYQESKNLMLSTEKAYKLIGWSPVFDFKHTIKHAIEWYSEVILHSSSPLECCMKDIHKMNSRLSEY